MNRTIVLYLCVFAFLIAPLHADSKSKYHVLDSDGKLVHVINNADRVSGFSDGCLLVRAGRKIQLLTSELETMSVREEFNIP